jgi:hypothetical protein
LERAGEVLFTLLAEKTAKNTQEEGTTRPDAELGQADEGRVPSPERVAV